MSTRRFLTAGALIVALFSQMSFAALRPLSQSEREEKASDIATGYVVSVKKVIHHNDHGSTAKYTIQMIVSHIQKGNHAEGGKTLVFHYWRLNDAPLGWCGDGGQMGTIKHYQVIKAYLTHDDSTGTLHLLNPNGFDLVEP